MTGSTGREPGTSDVVLQDIEKMVRQAAAVATAGWKAQWNLDSAGNGPDVRVHTRHHPNLGRSEPRAVPEGLVRFAAAVLDAARSLDAPLAVHGCRSAGVNELVLSFRDVATPLDDTHVYHGTSEGAFRAIRQDGLMPGRDGYVYLTDDATYAESYATRKGGRTLRIPRLLGLRTDVRTAGTNQSGYDLVYPDVIPAGDIEVHDGTQWIAIREYEQEEANVLRLPTLSNETPRDARPVVPGPDFAVVTSEPGERFALTAFRDGAPLDEPIIARAGSLLSLIHFRITQASEPAPSPAPHSPRPRPMRPRR